VGAVGILLANGACINKAGSTRYYGRTIVDLNMEDEMEKQIPDAIRVDCRSSTEVRYGPSKTVD
jgi:hypothetical protein